MERVKSLLGRSRVGKGILVGGGIIGSLVAWNTLSSLSESLHLPIRLPRIRFGNSSGFYRGTFAKEMNRKEAALVLGVNETFASIEDVKDAHYRLIRLNHPDIGGSVYLTRKINEAKDILMGAGKKKRQVN
uniref:Pam18/Tim14 n=1 Tax=Stygiella incarcerata TaxID=1712417 RepID=A0A192ZJ97_9EUKA|nr:Pam18/Tim14 [Stygiella incarcerata]